MRKTQVQIGSDYPAQLQVGSKIYSASGFLIGVITEVTEPDIGLLTDDATDYILPDDRDYTLPVGHSAPRDGRFCQEVDPDEGACIRMAGHGGDHYLSLGRYSRPVL